MTYFRLEMELKSLQDQLSAAPRQQQVERYVTKLDNTYVSGGQGCVCLSGVGPCFGNESDLSGIQSVYLVLQGDSTSYINICIINICGELFMYVSHEPSRKGLHDKIHEHSFLGRPCLETRFRQYS